MLPCNGRCNTTEPVQQILPFLSPSLREIIQRFIILRPEPIEEIRLRLYRPLVIEAANRWMVKADGSTTIHSGRAWMMGEDDFKKTLDLMTESSIYAVEEEIRQGFITLPGGHRIGLVGECMTRAGRILRIRNITGINIRIAREMVGIARPLLPYLWNNHRYCRTLIVSPPKAGKTTLLRDMVRGISDGDFNGNSAKVGLVDERSELTGSLHGVPQLEVGIQTDVLVGGPKVDGIYLLLRTMSPDVVAVDELGHAGESEALRDLLYAGVGVLATAHADSIEELRQRSMLSRLLRHGGFERIILLSRRLGAGTVEEIYDEENGNPLFIKNTRGEGGFP